MLLRRVRLVLVVVTLVVIQTTVFPSLRVFGAIPDLCLVATVAMAYEEGPHAGLIFGFASGLAIDLFLSSPMGLSAFAFAATGYAVGIFQSGLVRESRSISPVIAFAGGIVGGSIFVVVGAMVGESGYLSLHSVQVIIVAALYDALVSYAVFPFVRWADRGSDPAGDWGRR